ncbi:MAG: flagellar basal body L-ring protein FlgH [Fuerstiella sp.]|nr:flagellar basal body L-ring protein FlgH [Fuerstiella sp.]
MKQSNVVKRIMKPLCLSVCGVFAMAATAPADSLWHRQDPQQAFLFEDSRARRPGDLLTLIISESTSVNNRENKGLNKSSDSSINFDLAAAASGGFNDQAAATEMDTNLAADRKFSGGASYNNSRELSDRITVTVVQVLPNGNLVLCGQRQTTIAGELRQLRISGIARPIDIGPDNTITSRFIANMRTSYTDTGQERHFTRQGWLGRKVNKLWPF